MLSLTRLWRRIGLEGLEHLTLQEVDDGFRIYSVLSVELELGGITCEYHFDLDRRWRTQTLKLAINQAGEDRKLHIERAGDSQWKVNGEDRADLNGALDIDLSVTPFTNTLAIRQLALTPDEAKEMTAVYINPPKLEVTPARQRYRRLDSAQPPTRFLYEGLDTGFVEEITVDEYGLVVRYPRFAERVG